MLFCVSDNLDPANPFHRVDRTLNYDECNAHFNCTVTTPMEAAWRLSEYELYKNSHTIMCLSVHTESDREIYFREGEEENALRRTNPKKSTLEAVMTYNAGENGHETADLLYTEIPQLYRFHDKYDCCFSVS